MKPSELRKLEKDELVQKCNASLSELKKVKFSLKSGDISPENVNKARTLKLEIARIKTISAEMQLIQSNS